MSGQSRVRSANHRRTKAKQNNGVTSLSPDPLSEKSPYLTLGRLEIKHHEFSC